MSSPFNIVDYKWFVVGAFALSWVGLLIAMNINVRRIRNDLRPGTRLGKWIVVQVDGDTVFLTHATDGIDCYCPKGMVFPDGVRPQA